MSASTQEHEHDHGDEHLLSIKMVVIVWLGLVALTGVTVGAAYVDLKHLSFVVAMIIATIKSTLVVMYFMHMRYEKRVFLWFFISAIATYVIFVILTFADYIYR